MPICDQVGMKVLLDKTSVFQCHKGRWDAIFFSELGSSWAILTAGYNLDSLMLRYQGVDWRNKDNWNCNARCACCWEVGANRHTVCGVPGATYQRNPGSMFFRSLQSHCCST